MEEIIEIVVSLIGLIFYWLLTSRKASKKKKIPRTQPPSTRSQPKQETHFEPEPEVYEPVKEEVYEEEPEVESHEPITFDELLEQFTGGRSKKPVFKAPEEGIESIESEKGQKQDAEYLDEYRPILKNRERLMKPGEHTGSILKKSIEELPTPKISTPSLRSDGFKLKKRQTNRFTKTFRDKDSLRNALIMKEIFDRKYF